MRWMLCRPLLVACLLVLCASCGTVVDDDNSAGDADPPAQGREGGPCYGNGTCDDGLVCLSDLCVRPPDGGADEDVDASSGTDPDASVNIDAASEPVDAGIDAGIDAS